ncbi:cache domain-containing sensor histidine kinase [[Clostridium] fimetarium]|nr:histidine kinase [[Clostridium] fimetarium]
MKTHMRRAIHYYKSHIWCTLLSIFVLLVFSLMSAVKVYTEKEYLNYLTDKTMEQENTILNFVSMNLEYALNDIIEVGSKAATNNTVYMLSKQIYNGESTELTELNLETELNNYTHSSQWIEGVCISSDGLVLSQYDRMQKTTRIWNDNGDTALTGLYEKMKVIKANNIVPKVIISLEPKTFPGQRDIGLMHISVPISQTTKENEHLMMITVSIRTELWNQYFSQIYESYKNVVTGYLVDSNGTIIYHNETEWIGKTQKEYLDSLKSKNITTLQSGIGKQDLVVNIDIDKAQLLKQVKTIYNGSFIVFMVMVVLLVLLLFISIQKSLIKPIQIIIKSINRTRVGKEHKKINVYGNNEVWQVAQSFNQMMKSLDESYKIIDIENQDKMTALKMQRNAEREALESQINAHFICNTINVINYEAMDVGDHKVSVLLKKLSNILRYSFDQRHQNVYLSQEIAWLEQYLFLQKTRFEDLFEYKIDFPDILQEWSFRKLMLQPFVENAIIHGFEGRRSGGMIQISGQLLNEDMIQITIEDNGCGMDAQTESNVRNAINNPYGKQSGSMGISNVVARIRSYYGENTYVQMENEEGKGCKFIIQLPKQEISD